MAVDPKSRLVTITYPKGHMTASVGLVEYLLGNVALKWEKSSTPAAPGGRRKRKYGTKQRSSAIGGREITLQTGDGKSWKVRVAGADIDFIDYILANTAAGKVVGAYTARGSTYGPQFPELP
jgi:hypothetical protein